jgi:lipid A 3-O-deacylase
MKRALAAALLMGAQLGPAQAGEAILGFGYDDVLNRVGGGGLALALDLRSDPLFRLGPVEFGVGAAVEADSEGDLWAGGGVFGHHGLGNGLRLEGSLMAGGYAVGSGTDLGSDLQFRSRIGVSRALGESTRIGLAVEHKSNAGIADANPGIETVFVTLARRF